MRTIDGVEIVQGLEVFDYNLDVGKVDLTHVHRYGDGPNGIWFDVILKNGGRSLMNASRVWRYEPFGSRKRADKVYEEE